MIRMYFSCFFLVSLTGCLGLSSQKNSGDFYTWVDGRGQLQTLKRNTDANKQDEDKEVPLESEKSERKISQAVVNKNNFSPDDFISSDSIDKEISGIILYSWNQDGRQEIVERNKVESSIVHSKPVGTSTINPLRSFFSYREGQQVLLSELLSKELDLANIYINNKILKTDYVLIEIDMKISTLQIKSFIRKSKSPLPDFAFLNSDYMAGQKKAFFNEYIEETWAAYGFFNGYLDVPNNAAYILITPNPLNGVIETLEKEITLSNLGRIEITSI